MFTPISSEHLKGAEEQREAWRGAQRISTGRVILLRAFASPFSQEAPDFTVLEDLQKKQGREG
jgi:hypothetical protein